MNKHRFNGTHYLLGGLFENFILAELLKSRFHKGLRNNCFFWRDHKGSEIDCVIDKGDQLIPIGMSQICSVNFEQNIREGVRVKKGDMLGYFLFGGSDFIMIFQKRAGFVLQTATREDNGQSYLHTLMGERYGVFTGSKE
jgi:hypothetical protein